MPHHKAPQLHPLDAVVIAVASYGLGWGTYWALLAMKVI